MQIIIGEGQVGMARIVSGSTERQLIEMCRQSTIKLVGIVSSSDCHWYWPTLYACMYVHLSCASAWLLTVSYAGKCTLFNDALVWIRPQFSSIQWTDFFILH